jgi:hypothetical protein
VPIDASHKKCAIRAFNGQYVSAEGGGGGVVTATLTSLSRLTLRS